MKEKFKAIYMFIDDISDEVISQDQYCTLRTLISKAEMADSEIRHKFRDLHVEALDSASEWEKKFDKATEEADEKAEEVKSLERDIESQKDEIGSLQDSVNELEEKVRKLQEMIDTKEFA